MCGTFQGKGSIQYTMKTNVMKIDDQRHFLGILDVLSLHNEMYPAVFLSAKISHLPRVIFDTTGRLFGDAKVIFMPKNPIMTIIFEFTAFENPIITCFVSKGTLYSLMF